MFGQGTTFIGCSPILSIRDGFRRFPEASFCMRRPSEMIALVAYFPDASVGSFILRPEPDRAIAWQKHHRLLIEGER
jgi:hypothetical protein